MHIMRDAVNYCLPVIQNPLDGGSLDNVNAGVNTNTPGNGYYGFLHRQLPKNSKNEECFERMDAQTCQPSIEFNNSITMEADCLPSKLNGGQVNRKRAWEYGDETQTFKKMREGELLPPSTFLRNSRPLSHLKQPTHNVPDMPRCIMGHYI